MIERHLLAIVLVAAGLSACAVAPPDFEAHTADDVALRHPIELRQGWQELSVPIAARLDEREQDRLADFVADWRRFGAGPVYLRIPSSLADNKATRVQITSLRQSLADHGMHAPVTLLRETTGASGRTPLMIASFRRMKAEVITECGRWPDNLATGPGIGWQNRSYANFGCAQQSMIAAQTADPRDLFSPRAQTPVDAQMRVRALDGLRSGNKSAKSGE